MKADVSAKEARRLALAAVGLAKPRPARPGPAAFGAMIDRLGQVQMDSVNVLARAHYMPGFARLGDHDVALLDKAASGRKRRRFEAGGHEAALIGVELQPALRWKMARVRAGTGGYVGLRRFAAERGDFVEAVRRQIEERGPLAARDLDGGGKASGSWWGWSDGKRALEWLFAAGLVTTQARRGF
ncbi:MAG: crosslink repair DNA glycosylase YcaQ family protein, partial [Sphingomonadaceae bacterium]|nr:crosslink repair DNA glycosylase YcaQ family protein [Sphingomonadaceae bacterium]